MFWIFWLPCGAVLFHLGLPLALRRLTSVYSPSSRSSSSLESSTVVEAKDRFFPVVDTWANSIDSGSSLSRATAVSVRWLFSGASLVEDGWVAWVLCVCLEGLSSVFC